MTRSRRKPVRVVRARALTSTPTTESAQPTISLPEAPRLISEQRFTANDGSMLTIILKYQPSWLGHYVVFTRQQLKGDKPKTWAGVIKHFNDETTANLGVQELAVEAVRLGWMPKSNTGRAMVSAFEEPDVSQPA